MTKEKKIITYSSMAFCLVLIFIYCLSPIAIGLNHGGNNTSLENALGLEGANNGFFYTGYKITGNPSCTADTGYAVLRPVVYLCSLFSQYFDIRVLSFIYCVILLISIFYLNKYISFKNRIGDILFAGLTLFIAFDLSYLLYLNTLYYEGLFYVLFILSSALYVKLINSQMPQLPTTVLFIFTAWIICGLKANYMLLSIPYGAMVIYLIFKRKTVLYRIITVLSLCAMLILSFIGGGYSDTSETDKFHSVFYGVLYENPESENVLKSFDIDSKYASMAGKNHYDKLQYDIKGQEFKNNVTDKISAGSVFKYYITNPQRYLKQYKYVGWNALETYPKYVGNYTVESGKDAYAVAKGFRLYNTIKAKLFPKEVWFFWLIPALLIALLMFYKKKLNTGYVVMGIAVSIMNIILYNLPMMCSGLVDIARTMAPFNITFDFIVIMLIMTMVYTSLLRKQEFKEKYGLTQ